MSNRFGYDHLTPGQQQKVDSDTALFLKQMGLYVHAEESWSDVGKPEVLKGIPNKIGFLLESPEDPKRYVSGPEGENAASFWAWKETQDFVEWYKDQGMMVIHCDQGSFGHHKKKPTGLATNLPVFAELDECRCGPREVGLADQLGERIVQTEAWSTWAPGLKAALRASLMILCSWHGFTGPRMAKALDAEGWKQHVLQQHHPYRRDCRQCVLEMGAAAPHRRRKFGGSSSWTLSVDVVHMPTSRDMATNQMVKYALVATALVPYMDDYKENPKDDAPVEVVEPCWGEGIDEPMEGEMMVDDPEKPEELVGSEGCKKSEEPVDSLVEPPNGLGVGCSLGGATKVADVEYEPSILGEPPNEDSLKHDMKDIKEEIMVCNRPWKVKHVTMVEPIVSRATGVVMKAMGILLTKMKYLGIPIHRVHSDRAKELLAQKFNTWLASRGVHQTFTEGDAPQSSGHVESEVLQLKRRTRLLLKSKSQPISHWPQAIRHAADERLRNQLRSLGTPVPNMLPYWSPVVVKRKRWHDKHTALAPPFVEAFLICGSPTMTSGWLVVTKDGHVLNTREVVAPDPVGEQVQIQLQELERDNPHRPPFRLVGKQPFPGRFGLQPLDPRKVLGGESLGSFGIHKNPKDHKVSQKVDGDPKKPPMDNSGIRELDEIAAEMNREGCEDSPKSVVDLEESVGLKGFQVDVEGETNMCRTVHVDDWLDYLNWEHQMVLRSLDEMMNVVPTSGDMGEWCGSQIEMFQQNREYLEEELNVVNRVQENNVVRVCTMQTSTVDDDEVLQTTTIPLSEVRKDLAMWKPAMLREYNSLVHETKAIEPIDVSQLPTDYEEVPGKLVVTRKAGPAGGKLKCRAVVCGNLMNPEYDPVPSVYASGADSMLIRSTLRHASQMSWGCGVLDVRTAFLLAPRPRPPSSREIVIHPPRILIEAGVCTVGERWKVHHALYGFTSSPALWSNFRDERMATFKWKLGDRECYMQQTPEGNLWKILTNDGSGNPTCLGHVLVYVDDLMCLGPDDIRESFFNRVREE